MVGTRKKIRFATIEMGPKGFADIYNLMIDRNMSNPVFEKMIFSFRKTKRKRSHQRREGF